MNDYKTDRGADDGTDRAPNDHARGNARTNTNGHPAIRMETLMVG